ncbi:MAG TPA: oligopeptide/dipeptide ABC transporter ATP-binding protein [Thermoanaerobaculia bacterium]|nr:oligopeptide/dipeptide ABC transporter ATP-binding protein [Thermoanaerobaculia bacterium]
MSGALLRVEGISKTYAASGAFGAGKRAEALDGVSFDLSAGEALAIAGESGSGKTTLGLIVARLEEPTRGAILLDGEDWLALSGRALRRARRNVQIVFQDPATSLDPRMRAGDSIAEPLRALCGLSGPALRSRVAALLGEVGLEPSAARRYPREFSGGERQRIAIARAIAPGPRIVVCDEPVAALDASARARVLNLLLDLRERTGVAYLFISHDMDAIRTVADRVAVLYGGRLVEEAPAADFFSGPRHPYSAALLAGRAIPGEPPDPASLPPGCRFHPRCPSARSRCSQEEPPLAAEPEGRRAACFFPSEQAEKTKLSGADRVIG